MARIEIPFKPSMMNAILMGKKFCTTRSEPYGREGDFFEIGEEKHKFLIVRVEKHTLQFVANCLFQAEGTPSPQHFRALWAEIHPRRGFIPGDIKWTHWFVPVEFDTVTVRSSRPSRNMVKRTKISLCARNGRRRRAH